MNKYAKIVIVLCILDLAITAILIETGSFYEGGLLYFLLFGPNPTLEQIASAKIAANFFFVALLEIHCNHGKYVRTPLIGRWLNLLSRSGSNLPPAENIRFLGAFCIIAYILLFFGVPLVTAAIYSLRL